MQKRSHKLNKKYIFTAWLVLVLTLLPVLSVFADTPEPSVTPTAVSTPTVTAIPTAEADPMPESLKMAESVILLDAESNTVMYQQNPDIMVDVGFSGRMMTAILALELLEGRYDEKTVISEGAAKYGSGTDRMVLKTGESIDIYTLFCGLIIFNANDAAYALAEACALDEENPVNKFIEKMNEKALELGMKTTVYTNVSGFDGEGYTTAHDVMILSRYIYNNQAFREIAAIEYMETEPTDKYGERKLYNRNYLLSRRVFPNYIMKEANGLSAGYTEESGYGIAATARLSERDYICVVLNAAGNSTDGFNNFIIAKDMLYWGDGRFNYFTLINTHKVLGEIKVRLSEEYDYVSVVPKNELRRYLPNSTELDKSLKYKVKIFYSVMTSPVKEGETVGYADILLDGKVIDRVELVTMRAIAVGKNEVNNEKLQSFVSDYRFIIAVSAVVVIIIISILVRARLKYNKARKIRIEYE